MPKKSAEDPQEDSSPVASGKLKLAIDFQLHDNGNATAKATPIDSMDLGTTLPAGSSVPVWVPSDPTALAVSAAADGLSCLVTPASPPKLATGVTVSMSATLPDGSVIGGVSDPIDVVASEAVGFKIALQ